jgi:hypothetical protein
MDDRTVVKVVIAKLEKAGLIERTGEIEWGDLSCEWQPSMFSRNLDVHCMRLESTPETILRSPTSQERPRHL